MLYSKDLEFIMEAHNGLSARIVEEAGTLQMFKGSIRLIAIWMKFVFYKFPRNVVREHIISKLNWRKGIWVIIVLSTVFFIS